MWEWFTTNSIWFLSAAALGLTLLIFLRDRYRDRLAKSEPSKIQTRSHRVLNLIYLAAGGVLLALIVLAVVAIIISREGVLAIITPETVQEWLLSTGIVILAYIVFAYLIYRLLKLLIPRIVNRTIRATGKGRHSKLWFENRTQTLSSMLTSTIGVIIGVVVFFMLLSELGLGASIAPLLAGAGVVGVALGFGAQSLIKDFLNGLFILLEDRYNKGDVVKIAGIAGQVEDVNLRRTVLRDLDGIVHTIPNGEITTASNYTRDWARVNLNIPVAYSEDLDHVFAVINRVGKELADDEKFGKLIKTPPQVLRVDNFGDSGIDIKVLGETKPMMHWEVTGELRKRIKEAFDEEGIEIPWPHVKLFFGDQSGESVICKACSHPNPAGNKFCSNCGGKL
jgi:small conductance mechanosensitive channel